MSRLEELREKANQIYCKFITDRLPPELRLGMTEQQEARAYYNHICSFESFREISEQTGMSLKPLPPHIALIYNLRRNGEYRRLAVRPLSLDRDEDPVFQYLVGFEEYCFRPTPIVDELREQNGLPPLGQKIYASISFKAQTKAIALRRSFESARRYYDDDCSYTPIEVDTSSFAELAAVLKKTKQDLAHMVMNEENYNRIRTFAEIPNRNESFNLFREYLEDEKREIQ